MGKHINHLAVYETHKLASIHFAKLPPPKKHTTHIKNNNNKTPKNQNMSQLLKKHVKFQMRRIETLDTAVIPDTSKFCLGRSVFYSPFTNEAEVVTKVLCSTWHCCWGLTPNLSHDGICHGACSLSCQGIFFCLLEAIILLTQWATWGSDLNLLPPQGSSPAPQKARAHYHQHQPFPLDTVLIQSRIWRAIICTRVIQKRGLLQPKPMMSLC